MGNAFYSGNNIHVQTDKHAYNAGDTITGNIYLNIHTPFASKGVFLEIEGFEFAQWEERCTRQLEDGRQEEYIEVRRQRDEFFCVKVPVYQFPGGLMPGQYTFPFQFTLPRGLPGVFVEAGRRYDTIYDAKVFYRIEAECESAGWLSGDIRCAQNLIIHEAAPTSISIPTITQSRNVMMLCCINKGKCTMTCSFSKNAFVPGETCEILATVNNESSVDVSQLTVKLIKKFTMCAQGARFYKREVVSRATYPGVKAGQALLGAEARRIPIQLLSREYGGLQPQTHGRLVKCEYEVEVECDIPWAPDVEIHLPVTIYAPETPPPNYYATAPQGWNPAQSNQFQRVEIPISYQPR